MENIIFEFDEENRILICTLIGEYTIKIDSSYAQIIFDEMVKYNCTKFIFDITNGSFKADILSIYNRPKIAGGIGFNKKWKYAFVNPNKDKLLLFLETVAVNLSYYVKSFDTLEEAKEWMKD